MTRAWGDLDAKIQSMVNSGVPIRRIADAYNIPYSTVRSRYCKSTKLTFNCRLCGASVTTAKGDRRRKYCSRACMLKAYIKKDHTKTFYCKWCGASVTIDQRKDARKKFCSVECRDHYFTCKRRKNKQRYIDRVTNGNTTKRV